MSKIEEYSKEIIEDVKVDQLNLLDKQMILPTLKHKWVFRLIDAKRSLQKLNQRKKDIKLSALELYEKEMLNNPVKLPKTAVERKIDSSDKVKNINNEIEELELLVEYLEKVEKVFSSMSYDFSTIAKLVAMETT